MRGSRRVGQGACSLWLAVHWLAVQLGRGTKGGASDEKAAERLEAVLPAVVKKARRGRLRSVYNHAEDHGTAGKAIGPRRLT
jgi:hypothetical protein